MDVEIKDILVKLLEGQTRLETDVNSIKTDVSNLKADVSNLKTEVNKNSIKLESIEKKLDIIAEVQTSHKEQNERAFKGLDSKLDEKTSLIEVATKSISIDIKEVGESVEVLKDMTGRHEVDINILKRRPV